MEYMNVCYRMFHEDLQPLTFCKPTAFYVNYFKAKKTNGVIATINQHSPVAQLKYLYYEDLLKQVLLEGKRQIHTLIFQQLKGEKKLKNSILKHQRFLSNYQSKIVNEHLTIDEALEIYSIATQKSDVDIFKLIYQTLDAIVLYLEEEAQQYLDTSLPMSYQRQLWFSFQYTEQMDTIAMKIRAVSKPLQVLLTAPLDKIHNPKASHKLTYGQHSYYIQYIEALWKWLQYPKGSKKHEATIQHTLIAMNYNTLKVCYYICDEIKTKIKPLQHNADTLDMLYQYRKAYNTTAIISKSAYKPELPSLKEQLLLWIDEEIEYLVQQEQLTTSQKKETATLPKQVLNISVSEISLLVKLLHKSNLIKGPIYEVFQSLPKLIQTQNTQEISPESLRNKYYTVSPSTKNSIKKKLTHLLSHLD